MSDLVLRASLLDLMHELGGASQGILLAGGYGLYLKQLHVANAGPRTVIAVDLWPAPQDLDLLLLAEVVADSASMAAVRAGLDRWRKGVRGPSVRSRVLRDQVRG